jgi:coenzyme PQQ precursor peptide PqqA
MSRQFAEAVPTQSLPLALQLFLRRYLLPHPGFGTGPRTLLKETMMTWETPQATTFRFGFEITMYIANR